MTAPFVGWTNTKAHADLDALWSQVVPAAAGTLTGTTLASNVVASSLTSLGVLAALSVTADAVFTSSTPTTSARFFHTAGATTGGMWGQFINQGNNTYLGIESGAGGSIFAGTGGYSSIFGNAGPVSLHLVTNSIVRITISSAGAVKIANLAGSGSRTVVAAADGTLSAP